MRILLVTLAFLLRLSLIPNPGFEADISFWKSWGLATYDKGIVEGMKVSNNNYPTPFAYTLGAMVTVYSWFADPHNFKEFWTNTNLIFLSVSKMVPILADLGIAAIILYIGKNSALLGFPTISPIGYWLLVIGYLFSPIAIIDGALWGQVDSLGVFIFLLALLALRKTKPFLAGFIFMLAMMTKLQNMIYGPIFFLFAWQSLGYRALVLSIMGATVGFFGLNIEFVLTRNMDRVLASLTENYDYFPWMSLNAYNLWWIVSGAKGMATSDKLTVLGLLNAKTVGLLLFSSFYLFACLRQFLNKKNILQTFFESLIIVNSAFFLFQTQSHDRYAFPLSVFLLLWAPFVKKFPVFMILYSCFTLLYFYNLHTALIVNYPNNGLPILSQLTQPIFTIGTSLALLSLFAVFLFTIGTRKLLAFVMLFFVTSLFAMNYALLSKQSIALTKITPFVSEQGYGNRQTNKSVDKNRLSVQYFFYKNGIGTHANSKLVFDLNRKFTRFTTDFGIDTEAGGKASALFEIYGDNKLLFKSAKMGRYTTPGHAEVNISGVKNLTLITTDAGDTNYDDHTDWLNPILYP